MTERNYVRDRAYVLAHAIWAAVTSESAQTAANGFPGYQQRGKTLRDRARHVPLPGSPGQPSTRTPTQRQKQPCAKPNA